MPIRVDVNGQIVEFPDGTPEQEMLSALESMNTGQPDAPSEHPHARVGDALMRSVKGLFSAPTLDADAMQERADQMGNKHPLREGAEQAVSAAVSPLIAKAGGAVLHKVGEAVSNRAVPLVRSALKPVWATVRKRANIEGVMPSAVANSQARFIVQNQLRTPEQADDMVKALGSQIDDQLASVDTPIDTAQRVPRYLKAILQRVERQALPGADRRAIQSTAKEVVEDSPLSRTVVEKVEKEVPSQILDDSGRPFTTKVIEEIKRRQMRPDVTPSEGMDIARMTSNLSTKRAWGSEAGAVGAKAAEKTIERATRDSVKAAVPEVRPLLQQQGRAMDARTLLDRATWRDANRDAIGMGGIAGVANGRPLIGALLQLIKEKQLDAGLAVGRLGPRIMRNAPATGDTLQAAVRALLAGANAPRE